MVAVQVDEALEGPLFAAGEKPVDRAALVYRQVVLVEAGGEVAANGVTALLVAVWAEAVGDEGEVLCQVLPGPGHADELDQPVAGVIGEPVGLHHGDDAIVVSREGWILAGIEALVAAMRVNQTRSVEAVATHHAANGVGDEAFDVFFTVRTVKGDLVVGDFGGEFVLQAIGVDEEPVVILFK